MLALALALTIFIILLIAVLIFFMVYFGSKSPKFMYLIGYYDCGRTCQLTETINDSLQDLHNSCTFCNHNQQMLILILFIMAHIGCTDFRKHHNVLQIQNMLEPPNVLYAEKYAFLGVKKRDFPLVQMTYNAQSQTTIIVCTAAKTIYLILTAFLSTLKPVPFVTNKNLKYHSGVMNIYNNDSLHEIGKLWNRSYKNRSQSLYIVGHSLGGSSAVYLAFYLKYHGYIHPHQRLNVMTVASIRFGNEEFKNVYDSFVPNTLHIRATNDCLQRVPWNIPVVSCFKEVGKTKNITISSELKQEDSLHGVTAYFKQLRGHSQNPNEIVKN